MIQMSYFYYWGSMAIVMGSTAFISYWSGYRTGQRNASTRQFYKGYETGRKVERIANQPATK